MSLIRVFALALLFDHAFGFLYKDLAVSSKRFKSIASDSYGIRWVALEESGHLWISSNGTRGWNKVESLECKNWTDVAVDDSGLNIVAVAEDIWFSRDGGGSWGKSTSISSTLQAQVASSARGSRVYMITGNRVFKSNNYGANWTEISHFTFLNGTSVSKLNTAWKSIATDSTGNIIYAQTMALSQTILISFVSFLLRRYYSVTTNGNGSKVLVGSKIVRGSLLMEAPVFKISVAGYSYAMSW